MASATGRSQLGWVGAVRERKTWSGDSWVSAVVGELGLMARPAARCCEFPQEEPRSQS